jgi:hypothetical protein
MVLIMVIMVIDSDTSMNMMIVILTNDSCENDDDDYNDVDRGVMISYYVYLLSSIYCEHSCWLH